jgi:hypothetical protein
VTTLRRVAFCSGGLGALLLVILSKPVSRLTFGDDARRAMALLALAVFFWRRFRRAGGPGPGHAPDFRSGMDERLGGVLRNGVQHPHRLLLSANAGSYPRWSVWRRWAF